MLQRLGIVMAMLGAAAVAWSAPRTVRDDSGAAVTLPMPAQRVVSLSPGLTENLFHIGAGATLAGVDLASNFPAGAAALPKVGTVAGVDRERLLALRPDLVVVWGSGVRAGLTEWLRAAGIAVYVSEPRTLAQIATTMERLGHLTGHDDQARASAATFRDRVTELRRRYARSVPVTAFYQVWDDPLITVNGDQFISQVLELCGARNVFAALDRSAPVVSVEAVLARDPQVVVAGATPGQPDPLALWRRWRFLQAVRRAHLVSVPADLLQRPTARLLDGVQQLCQRLASLEAPPQR